MKKIDVCIVSTRRPELLRQTLASFQEKLFKHFLIGKAIINIDPIFGNDEHQKEVVAISKEYFPEIVIHEPVSAGFCAAVKRNWETTVSDVVLHMEDDWVLECEVTEPALDGFWEPTTKQVTLHTRHKNWDIAKKGPFHFKKRYKSVLGVNLPFYVKRPCFTTSPSFIDGEFARCAAALMDVKYDPEKQFYSKVNQALENYVANFRSKLFSPNGKDVVRDIGREWRDSRGIQKIIKNSASEWTSG